MQSYIFKALVLGSLLLLFACQGNKVYMDHSLPVEDRVEDLVARMTMEEKVSQMMNSAVGIPRLGIKPYDWWSEGLHGVGWSGLATVFPQAIAMAATWDTAMVQELSSQISTEFRAIYNQAQAENNYNIFKGLSVWSPNINIFRDPRWGRGQETYGEDPWLTSRVGLSFIRGLQGDHPVYLKTIATTKHYAAHSGPESLRHTMDVYVDDYDFYDTYAPAFEACIREGQALSIMGAYTRFRGKACCASPFLLDSVLRKDWDFKGYVVSDCGAIKDIYENHKVAASPAEAAAMAVRAGTDLECGDTFAHLPEALEQGLITEEEIDRAVKRLFHARFKLGMFDPVSENPWAELGEEDVDSERARQISLEAAQKSIVLLKNKDQILPLDPENIRVAVLGPNADQHYVMYGNYNGYPGISRTPLEAIRAELGEDRVSFTQGINHADNDPVLSPLAASCFSFEGKPGLQLSLYNNPDLEGEPVAEILDDRLYYEWDATPPVEGMETTNFSARWQGELTVAEAGDYILAFTGDDGFRVWINDNLVINDWKVHGIATQRTRLNFREGESKNIKIEYYQGWGAAIAKLKLGSLEKEYFAEALHSTDGADVILFFGGLTAQLEGEEMELEIEGFAGGDRTLLSLPQAQQDMLQALHGTGKPVILVLMNGSALALNWENKNLAAIVESWYPGQLGGQAIADVLFGKYNPAGRLPITFYKSVDDLPPFENYEMKGRTYRYFSGQPLYPFGYGLSYSTFSYAGLSLPRSHDINNSLNLSVELSNTGKMDGEEVVQLYITPPGGEGRKPIRSLKAFRRVSLKAGETTKVNFCLTAKDFALTGENGEALIREGSYQISVGGGQPLDSFKKDNPYIIANINLSQTK